MTYTLLETLYVKHPPWRKKAQIGVRSHKLYKLQLESPVALIGSTDDRDLNELWHRMIYIMEP